MRLSTFVIALSVCSIARAQAQLFRYVDNTSPALGWAVRGVGDTDNDGVTDLAFGSYRFDCGFAGCGSGPSKVTMLSGATQNVLWSIVPQQFDGTGEALDAIGDFNGDGRADVLVGAPGFGGLFNQSGEARILSGVDGSVLQTFPSPGGVHTNFGTSLAGLGDIDGDGTRDAAIASNDTVYICSGATGAALFTIAPVVPFPLSTKVARYGDFDHDGRDDVVVGQATFDVNSSGEVDIYSGATGTLLHTYASNPPRPTFGFAVRATGDIDADGNPDLVVGTPEMDVGAGAGLGFLELIGSATGNTLFNFSGAQTGEHLGLAVCGGRDFDGDGVADFAGAATCDSSGSGCVRYVDIRSGVNGSLIHHATSPSSGDNGVDLDFVGDLTNDNRSELAFGSACSTFFATCGEVRVYYDQASGPLAYCTAGTTTNGCVPSISATGLPSGSQTSGFVVHATQVEGQRQALFLYGINGRNASPWGTGTSFLCVKTPLQRFGSQNSNGTFLQCNGALHLDWLAYIAGHPNALGQPFTPGDVVDVQAWFRDPPAPKGTNLTNALEFTIVP